MIAYPAGHSVDRFGVVNQNDLRITAKYDKDYIAKYENYPCKQLSKIRWELCEKLPLGKPKTVFDFGYGNGAFLKQAAAKRVKKTLGFDISGVVPEWVEFSDKLGTPCDVMTFFDSLEHVPDMHTVLSRITASQVIISVPWTHSYEVTWLNPWRHFRPGEHLHYFTSASLIALFWHHGYKEMWHGNPEDAVRKSQHEGFPNILTAVFIRKDLYAKHYADFERAANAEG